ncbi:MAG: aminotransferase class I/II-fold pyridoxal phosphate-dependent enzyme [Planctomycetota bacterium]|nr:aminotransferase class I/II-fold pyridoxal phosphate-dependent enzyme [Planctomycetota bacterium]
MPHPWIATRTETFDNSGIRKVFDLAANLADPINLSIGQPDFDVPVEVKDAAIDAIRSGKNGYALTQGMPILRERLQAEVDAQYGHDDRKLFVTSGTSGGLVLAMMALVDPGDEVIVFDPYFVMYKPLVNMVGGKCVLIDTYPDFRIDAAQVEAAISPRTKLIIFNSPNNPTGVVAGESKVRELAELAARHNVVLLSDEIYRIFCYDEPFVSPARFNDQTLVLDGFSKSHAVTGWRLGYAHGPAAVIDAMTKLQQYTYVCAPHPFQSAGAVAMDIDMSEIVSTYRRKRNLLLSGLSDQFQLTAPGGAFYAFPQAPVGTGAEFVHRAIENNVLVIPGNIFGQKNSHFRISYAAPDETIRRGVEVLNKLAAG